MPSQIDKELFLHAQDRVFGGLGDPTRIKSKAEQQLRRSGEPEKGPVVAQEVPRDDSREREYQGGLARYYHAIISHICRADAILIFGPDKAKGELKKQIEKAKGIPRMLMLETGDKMTEPQIVARVRQHFEHLAPRAGAKRHGFPTLNQIKIMLPKFSNDYIAMSKQPSSIHTSNR